MPAHLPIISGDAMEYPDISSSVRLAIMLPTARWGATVKSILASLVGVANEEVAVLISDNSENKEKHRFLKKLIGINPNIIAVAHKKNIGGAANFFYLHDWCKDIEFSAITADDDWMSPTYHPDAYNALLSTPTASCISAGTTFVDIGDGELHNVSQPSMCGHSPFERMTRWHGTVARVTMYDVSRRATLNPAIAYLRATPIQGMTLGEDLYELSRLAAGDFLKIPGHGLFVHYPHHGAHSSDCTQRYYELLCKEAGLQLPMIYFMGLSTAVQCAMFLLGRLSPIADPQQRMLCAQHVFRHVFVNSFLPKFAAEGGRTAVATLFANHPSTLAGFERYSNPDNLDQLVLDVDLLNWFIEIIRIFESPPKNGEKRLSEKFSQFCIEMLG